MKHLSVLNKYFWKYKKHFFLGILFIVLSNYFRILSPQIAGFVVDKVQQKIANTSSNNAALHKKNNYDFFVNHLLNYMELKELNLKTVVIVCSLTLLVLAILGGLFMFFMRQTIIVMSRYVEFEQKNEIFNHYQQLNVGFYKANSTGDLMNRISEDVSRVRMYTGPALMYVINLAATISFSVYFMATQNWQLTLYVLAPLPLLAITIYFVNTVINKKSEKIQGLLSDLTTTAQESYSGIRVIKSFVQEKAMFGFFNNNSELYKKNAIGLAKVEAIYFPSMALMIGISTLLTIAIGCWFVVHGENNVTAGTITEFVIYINMLTFPVSAIGWTASMIQRAAASQKRLNEFLETEPEISQAKSGNIEKIGGDIVFNNVSFTYPNTGIQALKDFSITIPKGNKVLILGKTGSGKTTVAQLLLHFYNPTTGTIAIGNHAINEISLKHLRQQISYVPQDVFLFSDTVSNNIKFGLVEEANQTSVEQAAKFASIHNEIMAFDKQYNTVIGERGVTLSGGQKQRISIARALIKQPEFVVFDDCLSAVDAKTEHEIINHLYQYLHDKTALIITHRIFSKFNFDQIIVLDDGQIIEQGTHKELFALNGYYTELYNNQLKEENDVQ
ncbi:MAG: ABC transporter ATP-binding protein [Chitinophagaceae bacterium]|nr:ABC transporter ATP-binding protein [Chitinophagaceae bacterium]